MRRHTSAAVLVLALVLPLAGCSGGEEPEEEAVDPLCAAAPAELLATIADGPSALQPHREPLQPPIYAVNGATYPYDEQGGAQGQAVAMQFTTSPSSDDVLVGIWAQTSGGGIFASDGYAQEYTAWPTELSDGTVILKNGSEAGASAEDCLEALFPSE